MADYCFVRDNNDEETATILVACPYPSRMMLANVVESEGPEPSAVARLATFLKHSGYSKVVYKSDQEASIIALFEATFQASQREGSPVCNENLVQMVTEVSAVGESASNGKAENAVQRVEDMMRTYKSAFENHINARIPAKHSVLHRVAEHTASIMNRHVCNDSGDTPYETIHGQHYRGKAAEFGERVFYVVPKKLRSK